MSGTTFDAQDSPAHAIASRLMQERVRENYESEEWWSTEEAMQYSSRLRATINYWRRQKKFEAKSRYALYRINAESFKRFLQTGEAQVPVPPPKSSP